MAVLEEVRFSVDAGIINRLGLELVAKSETAVAELIKNAYDADANFVTLYFDNAHVAGGTLIIEDDGLGMNKQQLINGFMRLATSDKIHNSISEKYQRPKAGRKGIGRFSTQRLGEALEIITKSHKSKDTFKLTIDWSKYVTDVEISQIENELSTLDEERNVGHGTSLYIYKLRDKWSDADIKRVYRYVSELIQPNFLNIGNSGSVVEESKGEAFEVNFLRRSYNEDNWTKVADPQVMMFDRALATITGYIDDDGNGICHIESRKFHFGGKPTHLLDKIDVSDSAFELLKGTKVAFKAYYFIGGDRNSYYGISKPELKVILEHLEKHGGIKLYRNGFRIPKYGDSENDWLAIDKNTRIGKGIPFGNNRLLGFVQLTDPHGDVFEESAGREGLIEKEAFSELQSFISNALQQAFVNFASWFRKSDEYKIFNPDKNITPTISSVQKNVEELRDATKTLLNPDSTEEQRTQASIKLEQATVKFIKDTNAAINELEMMRVLAATGLTIAEFVHEIKQIVPSTKGYIKDTLKKKLPKDIEGNLRNIAEVLSSLEAYTAYFDETISKNVVRELRPIDLRVAVKSFMDVAKPDLERRKIDVSLEMKGKDLITVPMHPSEWNTILQNLYSNAKKAIIRSGVSRGKILIKAERDSNFENVFFEFQDNGIGIPAKNKERIFDPFFTTSKERNDDLGTGTGLGLYILHQMINNRAGEIKLGEASKEYKTCFKIILPLASKTDLKRYGY